MNSKAIAMIMAVAMAVVGFSVVIADESEAIDQESKAINLDNVVVKVGNTDASTTVGINEGNYTGYKYTLTWNITVNGDTEPLLIVDTIGDSSIDKTLYVTSTGIQYQESGSAFAISMDAVEDQTGVQTGVYTISVEGVTVSSNISYTLKPTIIVQTDGGSKTFDDFVEYTGTVNVTDVEDGQIDISINKMTAQVGKYYEGEIAFGESSTMDVGNYDWYAVGLPQGLIMASNGKISGIPENDADDESPYTITIFATEKGGNMYYATISDFTVDPKQTAVEANGFGYYVNENTASNKTTYLFSKGDVPTDGIKLFLTDVNGTVISKDDLGGYAVKVIGDSGIVNGPSPEDDGSYTLPSSGSGAYTVIITDVETTKTAAFTVYIIGQAADITASIVIEGA